MLYKNRLEALKGSLAFLKKCKEDFVVVADSDAVYKLNFSKVIDQHIATNADLTMVYHEQDIGDDRSYIMFDTDSNNKIVSADINSYAVGVKKHYMNVFVARTSFLLNIIRTAIARGYTSFSNDILVPGIKVYNIYGYKFEGYYQNVDSLHAYFKANMDLLDKNIRKEIFGDRDIYTKVNDAPPAKFTETAKVTNSLIHDGCLIEGTVENCILFRGVKVGKGTVLKNSIIMSENIIGENCNISYVVSDKDSIISSGITLAGCEKQPYFINKGSRI
jgi:glucose-1-phosphate adenylyltransferase